MESPIMDDGVMRSWRCMNCGWIYDEAQGDPESGLAPGTRWAEVPDDWYCPNCGAVKSDFEMAEL